MTIAAILDERANDQPHDLAFVFRDESLTYRQLRDDAERLAGMLLHDGIAAGDRVALLMHAGLDLIRLFYALQRIGAVPCIFDPHVPEVTSTRRIAAIRPRRTITEAPTSGATSPLPPVPQDPDAIAFLQPTSGTSGEPLAAVVLQRNVLASLRSSLDLIDPGPTDVLVGWVPPWHDLGLLRFLLGSMLFGKPCHLIPPAVRTIPEWLSTISTVKGTITGAPDFAWRLATRLVAADAVDLRSLRIATNGGEPVRASTIRTFEDRFGLDRVLCAGYGLAEATLGVSSMRPGDALRLDERGNVSCGKPLQDVEVRIEREEILVRGPAVFAGYFDAEDATRRSLHGGWLHTGDAGSLDADGNLYVFGRRRAMIKRGGATLAPRELEEAAQSVPGVRIAAAVGVPSALTEEIVIVVEAESEDTSTIESQVMTAVTDAIGIAPDRVLVQQPRTIPRTNNGKIRHAILRDQLTPSNMRSNPSVSSDGDSSR
ncbi:MAG TPA: AMP-binding protein [Thermoanaerobaculia bacterium]|jgi:acyl-CoA synthetase (AMP-forming)/AMP-acid ligase II|nr:AMP-binding protein [Thermoanaerobaculia bacterium]